MKTKEKIMLSVLELASENGLGNVSLSMIADKVGIRKASLFSHFKSKDDIIGSLYEYLRERARNRGIAPIDYDELLSGKSAQQVLTTVTNNYIDINTKGEMLSFYKFIYSERAINPMAAKIMLTETETMMKQTRSLLSIMEKYGLLNFSGKDINLANTMFCLTFHEMMEIQLDRKLCGIEDDGREIHEFIEGFCKLYA